MDEAVVGVDVAVINADDGCDEISEAFPMLV